MNYYAVIDTNVLVSALLKSASIPGIVARESLEGQIIPLLNDEIIAEYRTALSRPSKRPSTANLCWASLMPPSKPVGAADLCGPLRRGLVGCVVKWYRAAGFGPQGSAAPTNMTQVDQVQVSD